MAIRRFPWPGALRRPRPTIPARHPAAVPPTAPRTAPQPAPASGATASLLGVLGGKSMNDILAILKGLWETFAFGGRFIRRRLVILTGNLTLTGNGTGTIDIQLPTEGAGVVTRILCSSTGAFTARIQRTDDNKYITDGAIMNTLLFAKASEQGNGVDPFWVNAGAKLRFELKDTSGSSNTVTFAVYYRFEN